MTTLDIRRVRADEGLRVRALRLEALHDPAAPLAFLETYDAAAEWPAEYWSKRAANAAQGTSAAQYVAVARAAEAAGSGAASGGSPAAIAGWRR